VSIVERQAEKIEDVAQSLGVPASWLDALINFETGGTYDTFVKNPNSSARGLIQVLDSTAQSVFGVADSLALSRAYPSFYEYMDNVVYPYLHQYAPFPTKQSLYMAVFYPKFRYVSSSQEFPKYVQDANPGIKTVQDYISFVDRRIDPGALRVPKVLPVLIVLVGAGAIIWLWSQRRR